MKQKNEAGRKKQLIKISLKLFLIVFLLGTTGWLVGGNDMGIKGINVVYGEDAGISGPDGPGTGGGGADSAGGSSQGGASESERNEATAAEMNANDADFSAGYSAGMIDGVNDLSGKEATSVRTDYNSSAYESGYIDGYNDAFSADSNISVDESGRVNIIVTPSSYYDTGSGGGYEGGQGGDGSSSGNGSSYWTGSCNQYSFSYGSVSPTTVTAGGTYTKKCNYGNNVDCISTSAPSGNCSWTGWEGISAVYSCVAGSEGGTFPAYCSTASGTGSNCCNANNNIGSLTVQGSSSGGGGSDSSSSGSNSYSLPSTCSAYFSPSSLNVPGTAYLTFYSSSNTAKMSIYCRGPLSLPYGDYELTAWDNYPFEFDGSQTGTEICTFIPYNYKGERGTSCSASVVVNRSDPDPNPDPNPEPDPNPDPNPNPNPAPAPSCIASWNPAGPVTVGETSTLSWASTGDADGWLEYECTGPVPETGSIEVGEYPWEYETTKVGTEKCSFVAKNQTGETATCSASLVITESSSTNNSTNNSTSTSHSNLTIVAPSSGASYCDGQKVKLQGTASVDSGYTITYTGWTENECFPSASPYPIPWVYEEGTGGLTGELTAHTNTNKVCFWSREIATEAFNQIVSSGDYPMGMEGDCECAEYEVSGQCDDSTTVVFNGSTSTTSPNTNCSASFSPTSLTPPGVAYLTFNSFESDHVSMSCSGPLPIPETKYELISLDKYPFEFDESETGTETCTFVPYYGSTAGTSCSASVVVGSSTSTSTSTSNSSSGTQDIATCLKVDIPDYIGANEKFVANITMKNTGSSSWKGAYSLKSTSGGEWTTLEVGLPWEPVNPNQSVTFSFNATAPSTLGTHSFRWKMKNSSGVLFGETCGNDIKVIQSSNTNLNQSGNHNPVCDTY